MKKTVIITGGTDGLGKEIAKALSLKHKVVIVSPTEGKLKIVAKELSCDYEICDVTKWDEIERSVKNIIKKHGRIDCLINNAAVWIQGELNDNSPEEIHKSVEVNLMGYMLMTKAIIPQMKKQNEGLIININSQGGLVGRAERSIYNAGKWGLTGFTKSIQPELAKYGIGVTGIYPGKMKTNLFKKKGYDKDMSDAVESKDVAKIIDYILDQPNKVLFPEIGIKHLDG